MPANEGSELLSLSERLNEEMKSAMRSGDNRRRDVIRYLKAAVTNAAIEKRGDLDDAEVESIIRTQVKQRRDSIDLFRKGGREELAAEEEAQVAILLEYLPAQLSHDELVELVRKTADELNVSTAKDMSRLMPALVEAVAGRAEGRTLSELAKEELARRSSTSAAS
ncbi:MAG TPA: GatB/YqeY domain-containing protein [Thermomicrobiales bacterium]|nr:GatB/YqeY domain-containing protein [Thermomicrobiales bacterium]